MIKVCICDDHMIMREGLKKMLSDSAEVTVVDEAATANDLLNKLDTVTWDVLILDMSLPDGNGIDVLKECVKRRPSMPVLVLTMHDEEQYGFRTFKAGASGFITKDCAPELLITAILKVAKGEKYVSPTLAEKLVSMLGSNEPEESYESLSDREFEVLTLIGTGSTITEIAEQLKLSVKTISTYRTRIMAKLGLTTNADIIHYCIQNSLFQA
ncbi:MAG: two-component system invasion response regulator UvrY [Chlamydiales bacterium]|jgi:two-component system invasion response regulator UvrY